MKISVVLLLGLLDCLLLGPSAKPLFQARNVPVLFPGILISIHWEIRRVQVATYLTFRSCWTYLQGLRYALGHGVRSSSSSFKLDSGVFQLAARIACYNRFVGLRSCAGRFHVIALIRIVAGSSDRTGEWWMCLWGCLWCVCNVRLSALIVFVNQR
jgi:hypothetical protein